MTEEKTIPTAKPKEIYAALIYKSEKLYHIAHAVNDEKREWKTRCGRTLKHIHKSLVPVQYNKHCPLCATPQKYSDFDLYLAGCWTIRQRQERKEKEKRQAEMDKRRTACRMLAEDFKDILGIYIEEVAEPEHLPGASNIKCKTSIDGHVFKFTISIPL